MFQKGYFRFSSPLQEDSAQLAQNLLSRCNFSLNYLIFSPALCSSLKFERFFVGFLKVDDNICKFAKKGLTPSQIGVILRDSHGIAQVKSVTGSKILRILKAHGMMICRLSAFLCLFFLNLSFID